MDVVSIQGSGFSGLQNGGNVGFGSQPDKHGSILHEQPPGPTPRVFAAGKVHLRGTAFEQRTHALDFIEARDALRGEPCVNDAALEGEREGAQILHRQFAHGGERE